MKVKALGVRLRHHIRTAFTDQNGKPWVPGSCVHELTANSWELMGMLVLKEQRNLDVAEPWVRCRRMISNCPPQRKMASVGGKE